MPVAQIAGQVAPDVLELIRKTIFGGNVSNQSANLNGIFGPLSNPLAGSTNVQSLPALIDSINESSGGGPANNASGTGTPSGLAAVNAIGSVVANTVMSAFNPLAPTVANMAAHTPSTLSALMALMDAVFHPDAFNASIDTNAPESANANDAGLSQAADSQAANESADSGADSGVGDASSSAGDGGGAGGVGGGGDTGDSGDSGSYFAGGFVPGPSTGKDNQTINVDGGEVVIPADIVQMLGRNFFEDILVNTKSPIQVAAEKEAAKMSKGAK